MAPPPLADGGGAPSAEFTRDLGFTQVTLMGVGTMLGAGVFVGLGAGLNRVGAGGLLLVLALNGVLAMLSAMSYAELASTMPKAGGAHNFARVAFGRGWGFVAGWVEWCGTAVAGSLYARALALSLLGFLAGLGWLPWEHHHDHVSVRLFALLAVTVLALVGARGASSSGRLGALVVLGLMGTVLLVAVLGLAGLCAMPERLANFGPVNAGGVLPLLATMGLVYVVFQGYLVISQAGDEIAMPRRNLPRAILVAALVNLLGYLVVAIGLLAAIPGPEVGPPWLADRWTGWLTRVGGADMFFGVAVGRLLPVVGPVLVAGMVACGALAGLNALLFSSTRVLYAMGRDRVLPGVVARLSRRQRTPWVALVLTWSATAACACMTPELEDMAAFTSVLFLFLFLLVNLCCLRLRRRMGDELHYGFVMPLYPLVPAVAVVGNAGLLVASGAMSPVALVAGGAWVLTAVLLYRLYGKRHAVGTRDEIVSFRDSSPPPECGSTVLLPVANLDTALETVMVAARLAEVHQAEVELLHMVPIPDQVPLADAARYMEVGQEAITEAMLYLRSRVPLRETIRYCRSPARGILAAARDYRAKLILLGWRTGTTRADVRFGTTLDPVLERAPCEVLVVRECRRLTYGQVLVAFAGGPNSLLALRLASQLVDPAGGVIRVVTINRPGHELPAASAFLQRHADQLACPLDCFQPEVRVHTDVATGLAEAGTAADLIIIGAGRGRGVRRLGSVPLAEALSRRYAGALIMVKAASPVSSWLNRWF